MSLAQVKSVIESFVQNDKNDLLTIKGNWGVGKTYFWQSLVSQVKQSNKLKSKNYAYVSLFGIDNLESLKNLISASVIESKILPNKIQSKTKNLFSDLPTKTQQLLNNIPYGNLVPVGLLSDFSFLAVTDTLICFDDIERKGKNLSIESLVGFASLLKEQRNCKIVFILNDGTLSDADKESFSRHNEKVVDIELNFSPLPEEVFDYIFENSYPNYELIKHLCLTLKIENIRILQRVKRFIDDLLPKLENLEPAVIKQVINSMVLYVWSYYDKDSNTISFEFIKNFRNDPNKIIGESKEIQEKYNLLSAYDYTHTDELDICLMNFVKNGYLEEDFNSKLKLKNEEAIANKGKETLRDVWKFHRISLNLDEKEFIEKLYSTFKSQQTYLQLYDLYEVVSLLRRYDKNESANHLIDEFVNLPHNNTMLIESRENPYLVEFKDEYLFKKIKELKVEKTSYSFHKIIERLLTVNFLEEDKIDFLASTPEEKYYEYFKSNEAVEFYYPAKYLLAFGENPNERNQIIFNKTKEALKKLAKESRINRNRIVDWLKIDIDEE